jgi:FKBP12-rapamycin complex-associated protein
MTSQSSQVILSRIVPLVCQGLTLAPDDNAVWLEGLRMLADPKLRRTMAMTSSIWMPLLLKGIETARTPEVILAGLRLLTCVAGIVDPMKSCFVKPLKALMTREEISDSEELFTADKTLGLALISSVTMTIAPNSRAVSLAAVDVSLELKLT